MIEFGLIHPYRENGLLYWSFSLLPTILLEYDEVGGTKRFEMTWLFWGFDITRYY